MAMLELLRGITHAGLTVHGFRSTFRDWASEQTAYPNELLEMALAHAVSDKVEAAYRRGDLLEKRKHLMSEWSRYCEQSLRKVAEVASISPRRTRVARV
jgi:integrase